MVWLVKPVERLCVKQTMAEIKPRIMQHQTDDEEQWKRPPTQIYRRDGPAFPLTEKADRKAECSHGDLLQRRKDVFFRIMSLRAFLDLAFRMALVDLDQSKADDEHDRRANQIDDEPEGGEFQNELHLSNMAPVAVG